MIVQDAKKKGAQQDSLTEMISNTAKSHDRVHLLLWFCVVMIYLYLRSKSKDKITEQFYGRGMVV